MRRYYAGPFFALLVVSVAANAFAHVRLVDPLPRYPAPSGPDDGTDLKDGPCGRVGDTRTTDPDRITTFTPGETITVKFTETIDHGGHFRIAFDDAGQDAFKNPTSYDDVVDPPVLPILLDGIADKNGGDYEAQVTLPSIECETCTLQVIQVMDDGGPFSEGSLYFQCADIRLQGTPPDGGTDSGTDGGSTDGGIPDGGGTGATGGGGSGATGGTTGGTGGAGAGGTAGTGAGGSGVGGSGSGGTAGSSGGSGGATGGSGAVAGVGGSGGSAGSTAGTGGSTAGTASTTPDSDSEASCSLGDGARSRRGGILLAALGLFVTLGRARRRNS